MSKTVQRGALILTIILFVACIGLYFYGRHLNEDNVAEQLSHENLSKQFKFDGKLWFYDSTGNLLGTYTCQTANCGYAKSYATEADNNYPIESPAYTNDTDLPIANNAFVFLSDFEDTTTHQAILYSLSTSFAVAKFNSVNNYDVGLESNYYIVQDSTNKYGVISLTNTIEYILPVEYDFIGLANNLNVNKKVINDDFITLKDNEWNIVNSSKAVVTSNITGSITNYYGTLLISKSDEGYQLFNFGGLPILNDTFKYLNFVDKYLLCETLDNQVYLYQISGSKMIGESYAAKDGDKISGKVNDNKIDVYIGNRKVESVDITA